MVITTSDFDACFHFYAEVLGMEHVIAGGQHAFHFGAQKINVHTRPGEFQPAAGNIQSGSQDFCLITEGDISDVKEYLEKAGITIIEGPSERKGAKGLMDSVYIYDPDGNLVEIAIYR